MIKMLTSSRRVVMILLVLTTCYGFLADKISSDMFMGIVGVVIAFYFGQKSSPNTDINS